MTHADRIVEALAVMPMTIQQLAHKLDLPKRGVRAAIDSMSRRGIIRIAGSNKRPMYKPAYLWALTTTRARVFDNGPGEDGHV